MANGEIAHYEQFIHLPQCFQKLSAADASESIYMWERVKHDNNRAVQSGTVSFKGFSNFCSAKNHENEMLKPRFIHVFRQLRIYLTCHARNFPVEIPTFMFGSHIQQIFSRRLRKRFGKNVKIRNKYKFNYQIKLKTLWQFLLLLQCFELM